LALDQRVELSPPRAFPRSTMQHIVDWYWHGLMRLIDRISNASITLADDSESVKHRVRVATN
jgi:hypothetical protein